MSTNNNEETILVSQGITTALGVTRYQEGVNFAISVEDGITCRLLLYPYGKDEPILDYTFDESKKVGDIHTIFVEHLEIQSYEYVYVLDDTIYLDPYARRIIGREEWGSMVDKLSLRGSFDWNEFDWEGDKPLQIPYHQSILYSLHVRGFTNHESSKVKKKGTFEGIVEKIPYLKELGVNQIELMPAYEFDEIMPREESKMEYAKFSKERQFAINYWGYTKANYFAPKASYASDKDCVSSFKQMVKELHRHNIEVIMEFYFSEEVNPNMILDCIRYWVEEYHIDGVHVNSNVVPVTLLSCVPSLSHTKIMTEDFPINQIYKDNKIPRFKNLAQYNDGFLINNRKFLKGDLPVLSVVAECIRKNPHQYGVINYMADHNGFTLMDMVSYNEKHNEANGENNRDGLNVNYSWNCGVEGVTRKKAIVEMRKKQIKNALLLVLFSQGVPKINSGDEFGNSQLGNNNPYCQDNEISWLNWNDLKKNKEILDFTKELIQFRNMHPILHKDKELKIMDSLSCGYPDLSYHGNRAWYPKFEEGMKHFGILYCGKYVVNEKGKEDDFIYIAYNMDWNMQEFALPSLPKNKKWRVVIDTAKEIGEKPSIIQRSIEVVERSIVVLIGK